MKVLYFMNHVGQGGAALALYDLIVELKNNYDIEAVVFTGKRNQLNDMFDAIGVENHVAPYRNFMSSLHCPTWLWKIIFKIRHDMCLPIAIHKIETEVNVADFDIIHSNLNRIDIGAILAKKYNKPHLWHIREHGEGDFELIAIVNNTVKYMEKFHSTYVAISKSVMDKWVDRGLPEDKIKLVYDGVRSEMVSPKQFDNIKNDKILKIVFMGGYTPSKGQEFLVDALIKMPDDYRQRIRADFYGNGDQNYKKYLINKTERAGIDGIVNFHSYISDIYDKLNQYDIGINCSKNEGFGRITVEYMMAGLCTIATDTGANPELIRNEETGFLFEYGDVNGLISILCNLIDNPSRITDTGARASKDVRCRFSMKTHAKEIFQIYNNMITTVGS